MNGDEVVCRRCDGEGRQRWEEDGVLCIDACYGCGGRGWVDAQQAHDQRLGYACERLGALWAAAYRRARDSDEEGEGFAFCAAEHMMSPRDYEQALALGHADEAIRTVAAWSLEQQEWLVALAEW